MRKSDNPQHAQLQISTHTLCLQVGLNFLQSNMDGEPTSTADLECTRSKGTVLRKATTADALCNVILVVQNHYNRHGISHTRFSDRHTSPCVDAHALRELVVQSVHQKSNRRPATRVRSNTLPIF